MCSAVVEFLLLALPPPPPPPPPNPVIWLYSRWCAGNIQDCIFLYFIMMSKQQSAFSSFKSRLAAAVCAKKLSAQRLQLFFRCVCYNLLAWNDAKHACHVSGACHASLHSLGTECTASCSRLTASMSKGEWEVTITRESHAESSAIAHFTISAWSDLSTS